MSIKVLNYWLRSLVPFKTYYRIGESQNVTLCSIKMCITGTQ